MAGTDDPDVAEQVVLLRVDLLERLTAHTAARRRPYVGYRHGHLPAAQVSTVARPRPGRSEIRQRGEVRCGEHAGLRIARKKSLPTRPARPGSRCVGRRHQFRSHALPAGVLAPRSPRPAMQRGAWVRHGL